MPFKPKLLLSCTIPTSVDIASYRDKSSMAPSTHYSTPFIAPFNVFEQNWLISIPVGAARYNRSIPFCAIDFHATFMFQYSLLISNAKLAKIRYVPNYTPLRRHRIYSVLSCRSKNTLIFVNSWVLLEAWYVQFQFDFHEFRVGISIIRCVKNNIHLHIHIYYILK